MLFKKISATIILMLSFSTFATAPLNHVESLKSAYDKLNFSLQVEWDQKDKVFYNLKVDSFKKEVEKLQKSGLTNEELIEFVKRNIKDKNIAQDIDNLFNTIKASKMTKVEARKFALDYVGKNYAQGASWRGSASSTILLAALIVAIAILAAASSDYDYDYDYDCDYWDCYDEYVCDEYYDDYYGYWYTDCYWETYCY